MVKISITQKRNVNQGFQYENTTLSAISKDHYLRFFFLFLQKI